jgi:ketopantoate reductase
MQRITIVIGAGRVGTALQARSAKIGVPCALVSRDHGWEALEGPQGDPVILAVRNDDLLEVAARVPRNRRTDLVVIQNGAVRQHLRDNALERVTRGLIYFAVSKRGEPIQPGGTSWFSGHHGLTLARWFGQMGLSAESVDWGRFSFYELQKMCWIAAFGPLCDRHDTTVGDIADNHRDALHALVTELAAIGRAAHGIDVPIDYLVEGLCAYSRTIPDFRASTKEWRWRNGWFVETARRHHLKIPVQRELLTAIGHGHRIGPEGSG